MQTHSPRRFIIVVPPSETAGIGDALRAAFRQPVRDWQAEAMERLIMRLDQRV
jgi:hypothetical protein